MYASLSISRQNDALSAFRRTVCERRLARFRKAFTRDLTLTAKYNDDPSEGDDDSDDLVVGRRADDLSSGGPNENKLSDTDMRAGGVVGAKDTSRMVCEAPDGLRHNAMSEAANYDI
jgi:hypothetical protein